MSIKYFVINDLAVDIHNKQGGGSLDMHKVLVTDFDDNRVRLSIDLMSMT